MSYLLIVEPSKLMAELISAAIGAPPQRLRVVSDVPAAISAVIAEKPVAIVTTYELKGINGPALIAALKSDSRYRAIPAVLATSRTADFSARPFPPDFVLRKHAGIHDDFARFLNEIGAVERLRESAATPSRRPLSGRILLAEDATAIQKIVAHLLHVAGANVDAVANGAEAVEAAASQRYDLILMDIEMPIMDGWTATTKLRECGVKAPIVAFTAHDTPEFRAEVLTRGFDDLLAKPIQREALIQACGRLLTRRKTRNGAASRSNQRSRAAAPVTTAQT